MTVYILRKRSEAISLVLFPNAMARSISFSVVVSGETASVVFPDCFSQAATFPVR